MRVKCNFVEASEFLNGFDYLLPLLDFPAGPHHSPWEMSSLLNISCRREPSGAHSHRADVT